MKQPDGYTFDKQTLNTLVKTQRKHNYQMSYDRVNNFATDKVSGAYKITSADLQNKNQIAKKGSSNVHQVQIGNTRQQPDYKSLTALQQSSNSNGPIGDAEVRK